MGKANKKKMFFCGFFVKNLRFYFCFCNFRQLFLRI